MTTALMTRRELSTSLRSRWFVAYLAVFLAAGGVLAAIGAGSSAVGGYQTSLRALAGLMQLILLITPPLAVLTGLAALADDRDSGLLDYLLAQPVDRTEVYRAKWMGAAAAMSLVVLLGTLPGGLGAVWRGAPGGIVAVLVSLTVLLTLDFVGIGVAASAWTASRARATAVGLVAWLVLVVLGTLGLMAAFVRWGAPEGLLVAWSFINPVEAFRIAVVVSMDADGSLLGAVGTQVVSTVGAGRTLVVAYASLIAWAVIPGLVGYWRFRRAE